MHAPPKSAETLPALLAELRSSCCSSSTGHGVKRTSQPAASSDDLTQHKSNDSTKAGQAATGFRLSQAVPHCDPFMLSLQPDCQQDAQTFRTQVAVSQREARFLTESAKQMSLQHATVFTLLCNHRCLQL